MKYFSGKNSMTGFSIVEIMVGMVIALLGTIVIFQVFGASEGIKRTATNGGDAQQNGAVALLALERSLKEAGYGLNKSDTGTSPVLLTLSAASAPDVIEVRSRAGWDYGPFSPDPAAFPSAVPPALTVETFSINASAQLLATISGVPQVTQVISDGIVQMKMMYGTDANADGVVAADEWGTGAPANPMSVQAVAVGIVARSAQPEGKDRTNCTTTTSSPTWMGMTFDLSANTGLAAGDSWQCYRYKTFGVVAPMRNLLWRP